jgi:lincosamide and streptogramin A transport system ATP-binding/permease protein
MSLIKISDLTFAYEGSYDNIFENVSFQIDTDWKLGFIGRNGRGKTTFLNLLLKKYEYSGSITFSVDFEYFPYVVNDDTADTYDVAMGIDGSIPDWKLMRELGKLEVNADVLYRPFNTLSNGEQTKVLLAVLFLKENSFLLIDEPTNHLDMEARELVSNYLNTKKGFILVSHDRHFLDGCIDHVLSINRTNIEIQSGNFSSWQHNKELQDNYEIAENDRLKKEVKRLEKTAAEKAEWSDIAEKRKIGFDPVKKEKSIGRRAYQGAKAKKTMKRVKAIEERQQNAVEEKSMLLKNIETAENLKIHQLRYHSSRLVELSDISVFYGSKMACGNVSFTIDEGDRVALSGKNGTGKSSIIKLICGEDLKYTGEFRKGSQLKISYVPQDTSFLKGKLSDFASEAGVDDSLFRAILRKLDFSRVQFEKDMSDLSGGQKKKVLIARSLSETVHLHIWDEPLNFIDVISRMQIEDLLLQFSPTLLFVEHDREFCDKVATKTVRL